MAGCRILSFETSAEVMQPPACHGPWEGKVILHIDADAVGSDVGQRLAACTVPLDERGEEERGWLGQGNSKHASCSLGEALAVDESIGIGW